VRIGELSKRTGVAASRIRFYERRGVLPEPSRGENGYREYPETAVKRLGLIDGAQKLGFSLGEIRDAIEDAAPDFPSHAAIVEALRLKLAALDRHIEAAQARRRQILQLLTDLLG
jgi:DNA-binding transcriptional MerR regulator